MSQVPDLDAFMAFHGKKTTPPIIAEGRESGYYWIRLKAERWIIAEWVGYGWLVARVHDVVGEERVEEVIEQRLTPPNYTLIPDYMKGVPRQMPPKMKDVLGRLEEAMGAR